MHQGFDTKPKDIEAKPCDKAGRDELAELIRARHPVYQSLARDAGFSIDFSSGNTCFNHETNTVIISLEQLERIGIKSASELDFIVLHELGHFKEYREDPEGYLDIIRECKQKGSDTQRYFRFWNCLADIYVNTNTAQIAPVYAGAGSEVFSPEVQDIYRHKAFSQRDFTDMPLSQQYGCYLLNLGMGAADDIKLSPAVQKEVEANLSLFGESLSHLDLIRTYFIPAIGRHRTDEWQAKASERAYISKQTILPVFERLLKLDKEREQDLSRAGENGLEPLELDMDEVEEAVQEISKKAAEAKMTPEEKAQKLRKQQAKGLGEDAGLEPEQAADFAERLDALQPKIKELVNLFKDLQQPQTTLERVQEGHYKHGETLDIDRAIETFGKIDQSPEEARVMVRGRYVEQQEMQPRKIRLWLCPDLSGSMGGDITHLKDLTIALTAAMATLCLETEAADGSLVAELAVIGFSDSAHEILLPKPDITLRDAALAYSQIYTRGGTYEAAALNSAASKLPLLKKADEATNNPCLDILIVITDGDTERVHESLQTLDELSHQGMEIMAGIKILRPGWSREGGGSFSDIWQGASNRSGSYIESAEDLPDVIRKLLESHK